MSDRLAEERKKNLNALQAKIEAPRFMRIQFSRRDFPDMPILVVLNDKKIVEGLSRTNLMPVPQAQMVSIVEAYEENEPHTKFSNLDVLMTPFKVEGIEKPSWWETRDGAEVKPKIQL